MTDTVRTYSIYNKMAIIVGINMHRTLHNIKVIKIFTVLNIEAKNIDPGFVKAFSH